MAGPEEVGGPAVIARIGQCGGCAASRAVV